MYLLNLTIYLKNIPVYLYTLCRVGGFNFFFVIIMLVKVMHFTLTNAHLFN